jgi:hypothetical protein
VRVRTGGGRRFTEGNLTGLVDVAGDDGAGKRGDLASQTGMSALTVKSLQRVPGKPRAIGAGVLKLLGRSRQPWNGGGYLHRVSLTQAFLPCTAPMTPRRPA